MMDILIEHARELNCGSAVQIEGIGLDPKGPCSFLDHGAGDDGQSKVDTVTPASFTQSTEFFAPPSLAALVPPQRQVV